MLRRLQKNSLKRLVFSTSLLILVALVVYLLFARSSSSVIPSTDTKAVAESSAKGSGVTSKQNSSNESDAKVATGTTDTKASILSPTGTFVSNHHPSLSGPPEQLSEQSTCITNAGASCYILFISGSTTKKLPSKLTDSSGVAYWSWNVSNSGLGVGTWKVEAIATLNSQTKNTVDPINLIIEP